MKKILIAVTVVLLNACVTPVKQTSLPIDNALWKKHQQQVKHINKWDIRGRIAINTEDNGGQADLFWTQKNDQYYDIKLVAPFGGGTSLLQGRPQGVLLTTSDGQQIMEQDAETLLTQIQGWHFPVSAVRYWLLGVPSPRSQSKLLNWDMQTHLILMEQDGWRVEMRKYKKVGQYMFPKQLFISRLGDEEIELRMIIRHWGIEQ
jgi:outer membrane lipoprotein LolB